MLFILYKLYNIFYYDCKTDIYYYTKTSIDEKFDFNKTLKTIKNNNFNLTRYSRKLTSYIFMDTNYDDNLEIFLEMYKDNYIIPGLKYCSNSCNEMIPQGLTIANDYILITEYCGTKKHNSVIIMLDKNNGKYIKTIELNNEIWHVGGICFDGKYVYVTANQDKETKVSYIAKYDLNDLIKNDSINYIEKIETPFNSNAFVEYNKYDNSLYVGEYILNSFKSGDILNLSTKKTTQLTSFMQDIEFIKIKGIDYTLISRSCGSTNSSIDIWSNNKKVTSIAMPCFSECIVADEEKGLLYIIFESAANKYKKSTDIPIDRIIVLDLNKLKEQI